jgi:hypothetical protein
VKKKGGYWGGKGAVSNCLEEGKEGRRNKMNISRKSSMEETGGEQRAMRWDG